MEKLCVYLIGKNDNEKSKQKNEENWINFDLARIAVLALSNVQIGFWVNLSCRIPYLMGFDLV